MSRLIQNSDGKEMRGVRGSYLYAYDGNNDKHYEIRYGTKEDKNYLSLFIKFHSKKDEGKINGIGIEDLLAIVEDRLEHYQRGNGACKENELALNYIGYAIGSLMTRHKRIETDRKLDRELAKSKP